jgi:hypothetical protein
MLLRGRMIKKLLMEEFRGSYLIKGGILMINNKEVLLK